MNLKKAFEYLIVFIVGLIIFSIASMCDWSDTGLFGIALMCVGILGIAKNIFGSLF